MTKWLTRLFMRDAGNATDPDVRARYGRMAGWVGIVCNLLLAVSKLLAGFFSGSLAIMADAVNNFSDASSSVITLAGFKLSAKPADAEHPFGHARYEYIAGLAVAVMVLVIGIELLKSSIEKIIAPQPVSYGAASLVVLAVAVAVKLWMAVFNRSIGRTIGSAALEATFVDSRNDAITTLAVLAAALVARFSGLNLDGWMGAGVALFILISGVGLVKDTLSPLLGEAPDPELVRHIDEKISQTPGVLGTHDLIVHDYGPQRRFASAHVEMDSGMDVVKAHDIIDGIEQDFLKNENLHLIIHYDPVNLSDDADGRARARAERQLRAVDASLTLHDFRLDGAPGAPVYTFDVLAPPALKVDDATLAAQIEKAMQRGGGPVEVHLRIDRSYAPIP